MPNNSFVISKIRCSSPNHKKTAILNRNHLKYIATRPGVDLTPPHKEDDPSIYVKYIHYRPRSHGLFGNLPDAEIGNIDKLSKDIYQLSKKQNIYKGIVSLTEKDAIRLNFTGVDSWYEMLKATLPDVAQNFNIPIQHLKWVAAVHHEAGHPHVHYMLWRDDEKIYSPYIHYSVQNKCKEVFSKYILAPDREAYVHDRSTFRDSLISKEKDLMEYIPGLTYNKPLGKIQYKDLNSVSEKLFTLLDDLPSTGRLAYKFLPPDTKEKVDLIVQQILQLPQFSKEYIGFRDAVNSLSSTYSVGRRKKDRIFEKADKDLRTRMANVVLKQAKQLLTDGTGNRRVVSSSDIENENLINPPSIPVSNSEPPLLNNIESTEMNEPIKADIKDTESPYWSKAYKTAKKQMKDHKKGEDPSDIIEILKSESAAGNPLASMDLGMIYQKGFFSLEIAPDTSEAYYSTGYGQMKTIYAGIPSNYKELSRDQVFLKGYFSYRLGKANVHGTGTEVDSNTAKYYLRESLKYDQRNVYCQYALAKLYLEEFKENELQPDELKKELDFTKEELIDLITSAATGTPYAAYELARWYDDGYLVEQNASRAHNYYQKALKGFNSFIESEPDASTLYSLYYKIGVMHEKGLGTDKDLNLAVDNYLKAAELGNIYALSKLTNIYVSDASDYDFDTNTLILQLNELLNKVNIDVATTKEAHRCLGRIYSKLDSPTYDLEAGVKHLFQAMEQQNENAAFDLAKLYVKLSASEDIEKIDLAKLISYLQDFTQTPDASPGQIGQAYYHLGKMFSKQDSHSYDLTRSIECFFNAVEYKNGYALLELAKGYCYSSPLDTEENNYTCYNVDRIINELKDMISSESTSQKEIDNANYYLGRIYLKQECPIYNLELALKYLLPLAEAGNVYAQTDIGSIYLWGKHGVKDAESGKAWLEKAAQQNHEPAQKQLEMYDNIIQNQIVYYSYKLCNDVFSHLLTQSRQSHASALEHLVTHSKKLQKELQRKNLVKGAATDL